MNNTRTFYYFAFTYRFFFVEGGQAKFGREVLVD
jgi:hypothetical protein